MATVENTVKNNQSPENRELYTYMLAHLLSNQLVKFADNALPKLACVIYFACFLCYIIIVTWHNRESEAKYMHDNGISVHVFWVMFIY